MAAYTTWGVLACLTMGLTACGGTKDATGPTTVTTVDVYTPGNSFSPFSATIPLGGTIRFNISGTEHNAIFDRSTAGAPSDVNVVNEVVVSRTFTTRGTFAYVCTVHPGMAGQVVVQ